MGNQGIWVGMFLRNFQSRHTGPDMFEEGSGRLRC